MRNFGFEAAGGAPPRVPAEVVLWLATSPEAAALNGQNIKAQEFCHERRLLADWSLPS